MADKITLDKLRDLRDDWDDDGAPAPAEEAIEMAERILTVLRDVTGQAVPMTSGGVQLEWHSGGVDLEIVITPEGTVELE